MLIFVDPGHGGDDPGRIGHHRTVLHEAEVNWSVAVALAALLQDEGYEVQFTRDQKQTVSPGARARLANRAERDSVFVSLHCNGHWDASPEGLEVWHFPGSLKGERLARRVLESLENRIQRPSRGLKPQSAEDKKHAESFSVLASTRMPAILVEMEFLSNRDGQLFLSRGDSQVKFAAAIAAGVMRWIKEVSPCSGRKSSGRS